MRAARALKSLAASCAGVLLAFASAGTAAAGTKFRHGDWTLTCDNTGRCAAEGYNAESDANVVSVLLARDAGPNAPVGARVQLGDYGADAVRPTSPVRVAVAGRALGQVDRGGLTNAQMAAVLKALAGTGEVAFTSGTNRWQLSSEGATAVLLKMDDVQGRVGTPGALVKKGAKPESSAPGPVAPPVIQSVRVSPSREDDTPLARAILASREKDGDCDEADDADRAESYAREDGGAPALWRLGGGRVLVSRWCTRGGYNQGMGYWIARDQPPYDPKLVTDIGTEFDPEQGELRSWMKGRGLGDCWGGSTWTWDGHDFVLSGESTTGECRLVTWGGAWELPTLVSEVRKPR